MLKSLFDSFLFKTFVDSTKVPFFERDLKETLKSLQAYHSIVESNSK